jgi:hypothetical protein
MPFDQRRRRLREVVRPRRDEPVHAASHRRRSTRIRNEERRGVALDLHLGRDDVTQQRLPLLKTGDEFLSIKQAFARLDCRLGRSP